MRVNTGILHDLLREMGKYLKTSNTSDDVAQEIQDIVVKHAAGAAASALASGILPGAGSVIAMGVCVGFIWSMYYHISNLLGMKVSKNKIKTLATAVASNIGASIAALVAGSVIVSLIPVVGAVTCAILNFATVYIAAIIFIKLLTNLFMSNAEIENVSDEDLSNMAKDAAKDTDMKAAVKEAKAVYDQAKKDGTIDNSDTKPLEEEK